VAEEEKHLSIQQIEQLLEARTRNQTEDAQPESVREANRHLVKCEQCRKVVSLLERWDRFRNETGDPRLAERTPTCPPDLALLELAAGLTSDREAEELLEHVAACPYCGPLLRHSSALFAEEFSPEEQRSIASLATAKPERQASIALQISEGWRTSAFPESPEALSLNKQRPLSWKAVLTLPRLAWSAALAVTLVLAVAITWQAIHVPDVNRLLAQAYTERRTIELRFTGARYSPPLRERGAAGSMIDRPQSLLDANALISRRLKSHPLDSEWLHAKARADLLEWNYQDAIDTLREIQAHSSNSSSVQRDLATAYFERGEANTQPSDYGTAAQLLGEVLKQDPQDPVALFNRALVYERLFLYHEALDDWHAYLRLDDKSEWANEARTHVKDIKEKLVSSESRRTRPLLSPHEIILTVSDDDNTWGLVDERVEDYLRKAIEDWLPRAFAPQNKGTDAQESRTALLRLSRILAVRHKDRWLEEVLSGWSRPSGSGLAELSQAMAFVDRGEYGKADTVATTAEQHFNIHGDRALSARASLEHLIALDRTFEGQTCRKLELTTEQRVGESAYPWIQIQLLLESAICSASSGNLELAYNDSRHARDLARSAAFDYLYLRAQGFVAEYDTDPRRAFASNVEGLRVFWERSSDASRGHQFFEALAMLAEDRGRWQLATALNREAVLAIQSTSRRPIEATARLYLGRAEYRAGFNQEATSEWQLALQSLASLPADDAVIAILTELHVNLAKAALDEGRLPDASHELAAAAPRFLRPGLHEISIQYFSALGRLHSSEGEKEQANQAWQDAISRTEVEIRNAASAFDRIRLADLCRECFERLARLQIERDDTNGAWSTLERYRNAGLRGELPRSLDVVHLLEQHLPDEAALLSVVELDDGLEVWLVSKKEISFRRVQLSLSEFHAAAERFAAECSDRRSSLSALRSDGAQLYRWLILPFAQELSSIRFLIVERGQPSFSAIPFEALVDPNGQYLSERLPVAYTLGIAYLDPQSLSPKGLFLESALFVAGPGSFGPITRGLPPLPEATQEVREVSAFFRRATILEGLQTKSSVLRREIPQAGVFHFAGHASASPGRTGLLVASADGKESVTFWPEDFSDHLANLRLTFLSACSTAKSADEDSLDLTGLAQAYRLAGSKVVVGNKWIVDSAASRYFAVAFYRELAAGSSIPVAAKQAEMKLRRVSGFEHPYFWSAPTLLF
jgi:CHAT domain-containing protein